MKLDPHVQYLVLQNHEDGRKKKLEIASSLDVVIENWDSHTRISPVFVVSNSILSTKSPNKVFTEKCYITFFGPIHPLKIFERCNKETKLWLTLGLYNVVTITSNSKERAKLTRWSKQQGVSYESWELNFNQINKVKTYTSESTNNEWKGAVSEISKYNSQNELKLAIEDYCPLIASSISKSLRLTQNITDELCKINEYIVSILEDYEKKGHEGLLYPTLSQLLNINAGLTRFSSQTFSGITNILETDCHLSHHSLLGIGIANLALINLRHFIQSTLGAARIPERFALLKKLPSTNKGLHAVSNNEDIWAKDNLGKIELNLEDCELQIPLISYFSTRDGFKSTLTTISAPLTTFSACNALQWSFLTITHELTHIIVKSVISEVYPDFYSEQDMKRLWQLIGENQPAQNLLEDIRRFIIYGIIKMDQVLQDPEKEETEMDEDDLREILESWNKEVEEIIVHVFDYLYFYGSDIDKYIKSIWITWGTIPNLTNRLKEYVIRTICVSLANHLRRPNAEELAKDQVKRSLLQVKSNKIGSGEYIDQALIYLEDSWDNEIRPKILARKALVKFTKTFLYSESIAAAVRGETEITGKTGEKGGYSLNQGYIEATEIRNPLRFIELYTNSHKPSVVDSFWMVNVLAFSIKQNVK